MADFDPEFYDDDRPATVADVRMLHTKIQKMFGLSLTMVLFSAAAIVQVLNEPTVSAGLFLAGIVPLLAALVTPSTGGCGLCW